MFYNPETFRWEGNENALNAFDATVSTPTPIQLPAHLSREKEASTPRPALITNFSATKGVQVVEHLLLQADGDRGAEVETPLNAVLEVIAGRASHGWLIVRRVLLRT